ncbi:hypothetical protein BH10PSE5_BH10PSE5_18910 [soil metagenome]
MSEAAECRTCRETIKPGAQKCIHCGSSQGWQRHLGLSSSILALLIALISVTQSAVLVLVRAYQGDRSRLSMKLLTADGRLLNLVAANGGNRPGKVAYGEMTIKIPGDEQPFELTAESTPHLIQGGAMTEVTLALDPAFGAQLDEIAGELEGVSIATRPANAIALHKPIPAVVKVRAVEFNGEPHDFQWPVEVACINSDCQFRLPKTHPTGA